MGVKVKVKVKVEEGEEGVRRREIERSLVRHR
jgi:hypothetical protein